MITSAILNGPRLKVERAYRHIDELRQLTSPLSPTLYEIRGSTRSSVAGFQDSPVGLYVDYIPLKPIPETLALVIGDAAHNLRSALDHLATSICRSVDPKAKIHFPIHPKRKNLETAPVLNLIEEAIPGAKKAFLKNIRPENGPNESLWLFNDLDNDDKHNFILPAAAVTGVRNLNITAAGFNIKDCFITGDAASPMGIFGAPGFAGELTIHNNPAVSVAVSFGDGTPFKDQPVIPTLTQIAELVSGTIDKFQCLIDNQA